MPADRCDLQSRDWGRASRAESPGISSGHRGDVRRGKGWCKRPRWQKVTKMNKHDQSGRQRREFFKNIIECLYGAGFPFPAWQGYRMLSLVMDIIYGHIQGIGGVHNVVLCSSREADRRCDDKLMIQWSISLTIILIAWAITNQFISDAEGRVDLSVWH